MGRLTLDFQRERERGNSNSKTLFYKDCSLGSGLGREGERESSFCNFTVGTVILVQFSTFLCITLGACHFWHLDWVIKPRSTSWGIIHPQSHEIACISKMSTLSHWNFRHSSSSSLCTRRLSHLLTLIKNIFKKKKKKEKERNKQRKQLNLNYTVTTSLVKSDPYSIEKRPTAKVN